MRAFFIDRYGKNSGARIGERPDPQLRDNDVVVQVHAAGVNPLDSKIRGGEFKLILPYRFPLVLGNEVAGVIVRVGPKVTRFKAGDEVYARPDKNRIGTFAELIAMSESDVAIKPSHLNMEEAASIPLVGLTAWQALIERANLKKGQKVSSMPVPEASAHSRSSWQSILVRPWRRRRAPAMSIWSVASALISSSITRRRISRRSSAATTSSSTASAWMCSKNPFAC
jgi:D-arabinose 1-dehydrogenase-like Zn-dependent alcohol dehydrogenase